MKVGRNEPCPCGSGKKYKRCCLEAGGAPDRSTPSLGQAALPENFRKPEEVAAMSTAEIEERLRRSGVNPDRQRFLTLATGHWSAHRVYETWIKEDPVKARGRDEDFLLLASEELWERWIPERPSSEMVDDWMQDGYDLLEAGKVQAACELWWKVWQILQPRFTRTMSTCDKAAPVFDGMQSLGNWTQDFEMELGNASLQDARWIETGIRFCREFLTQFADEHEHTRGNFIRALAEFLMQAGELKEAQEILLQRLEEHPDDTWTYVALADAWSGMSRGGLGKDLDLAVAWLEKGKVCVGGGARPRPFLPSDTEVLDERLVAINEMRRK